MVLGPFSWRQGEVEELLGIRSLIGGMARDRDDRHDCRHCFLTVRLTIGLQEGVADAGRDEKAMEVGD